MQLDLNNLPTDTALLPRSTLAGWVGGARWWLEALHERLAKNVFASDHLFADDTPVPVLDPGRGLPLGRSFGDHLVAHLPGRLASWWPSVATW